MSFSSSKISLSSPQSKNHKYNHATFMNPVIGTNASSSTNNNDTTNTNNNDENETTYRPFETDTDMDMDTTINQPSSSSSSFNTNNNQFLHVLPVLLLEFLALALTRAVIPSLLLQTFHDNVYFIMGLAECIRGILAFIACPMFGKISDVVGRKVCLFVTVLGTCMPVCCLAIMCLVEDYSSSGSDDVGGLWVWASSSSLSSNTNSNNPNDNSIVTTEMTYEQQINNNKIETQRMWIFVTLLAFSGMFSSTFTLTFAYISDTVKRKQDRVTAYGLALATFGLSFTIGPMAGGYLVRVDDSIYNTDTSSSSTTFSGGNEMEEDYPSSATNNNDESSFIHIHPLGQKRVFTTSLILTIIDLIYIYYFLPESNPKAGTMFFNKSNNPIIHPNDEYDNDEDDDDENDNYTDCDEYTISQQLNYIRKDILPSAFSPIETIRIFANDPFMYEVGIIACLYYTSLWAVVSTLILYAAKRFKLGPERLGELMSALGLCTMISEAVLVRFVVPSIGEKRSMRVGLIAFALQCFVLAFAYEGWQLFICVLLSLGGNLVYPSLTSLVSGAVSPDQVGEALGAINGVKAMTEGIGPLFFGALMTLSEKSMLPGWPYLIASVLSIIAYNRGAKLPDENDEDYISEKYMRNRLTYNSNNNKRGNLVVEAVKKVFLSPDRASSKKKKSALSDMAIELSRSAEEYEGLLSEIEDDDNEDSVIKGYLDEVDKELKNLNTKRQDSI